MTNNNKRTNYFLSFKKSIIYLGLTIFGLAFKLLLLPGNPFILLGIGLFFGHLCYRSVMFHGNQQMKIIIMLLVTIIISIIVLAKFNIPAATIFILIAAGISLLIEIKTKKK